MGYDAPPEPQTLPEYMLAKRRAMGWSIKEDAQQLGVHEGTWGGWESGTTVPTGRHRERLRAFLSSDSVNLRLA